MKISAEEEGAVIAILTELLVKDLWIREPTVVRSAGQTDEQISEQTGELITNEFAKPTRELITNESAEPTADWSGEQSSDQTGELTADWTADWTGEQTVDWSGKQIADQTGEKLGEKNGDRVYEVIDLTMDEEGYDEHDPFDTPCSVCGGRASDVDDPIVLCSTVNEYGAHCCGIHVSCAGWKRGVPRAKYWYCRSCRAKRKSNPELNQFSDEQKNLQKKARYQRYERRYLYSS